MYKGTQGESEGSPSCCVAVVDKDAARMKTARRVVGAIALECDLCHSPAARRTFCLGCWAFICKRCWTWGKACEGGNGFEKLHKRGSSEEE
jgi:hypothetical protein